MTNEAYEIDLLTGYLVNNPVSLDEERQDECCYDVHTQPGTHPLKKAAEPHFMTALPWVIKPLLIPVICLLQLTAKPFCFIINYSRMIYSCFF